MGTNDTNDGYGVNLEEEAMKSGHPVTPEEAAETPDYGEEPGESRKARKDPFADTDNDAVATAFVEEMENN